MRRLLVITLAVSFCAGAAYAAQMPPIVRETLAQAASECRSAGGRPDRIERAVKEIDLNGDNSIDWVIDFSDLHCESAPSYFCGTGGCPLYLFVSQGNEYIRVWNDLVHAWKPAKVRGLPGIQFDLHGTACGLAGADACTKTYMFDGNRLREVK